MSEQTSPQMQTGGFVIPEWTLGWRMQRAMAHAGLQTAEIADEIGVSRSTVSRWINDNGTPPRAGFVKLWAMRCGVPYEWLVSGDVPTTHPDDHGSGMTRRYEANVVEAPFGQRRDLHVLAPTG